MSTQEKRIEPLDIESEVPQVTKGTHTRRQIFYITVIITAVMVLITVAFIFVYTGGHSDLSDHVETIISDAVKLKFESFKTRFHKTYANESAEQEGLVNFNDNL